MNRMKYFLSGSFDPDRQKDIFFRFAVIMCPEENEGDWSRERCMLHLLDGKSRCDSGIIVASDRNIIRDAVRAGVIDEGMDLPFDPLHPETAFEKIYGKDGWSYDEAMRVIYAFDSISELIAAVDGTADSPDLRGRSRKDADMIIRARLHEEFSHSDGRAGIAERLAAACEEKRKDLTVEILGAMKKTMFFIMELAACQAERDAAENLASALDTIGTEGRSSAAEPSEKKEGQKGKATAAKTEKKTEKSEPAPKAPAPSENPEAEAPVHEEKPAEKRTQPPMFPREDVTQADDDLPLDDSFITVPMKNTNSGSTGNAPLYDISYEDEFEDEEFEF